MPEAAEIRSTTARQPSKLVAIVVPASSREELNADEKVSLAHLRHFLDRYDKFLIAPEGSKISLPGLKTLHFKRRYFGSPEAHGRLLYKPEFYEQFANYEYLFFYHLDALVFDDSLEKWCKGDFDFLGAPWIPCADTPWVTEPRVGNGGFSIIKIDAALRVLYERYRTEPVKYWQERIPWLFQGLHSLLRYPRSIVPQFLRNSFTRPLQRRMRHLDKMEIFVRNSDLFWSYNAVKYVPEFRIADWKTGLRFAFEASPRECFELNDRQLPFGCHAWAKYDRAFWEPYLLRENAAPVPVKGAN